MSQQSKQQIWKHPLSFVMDTVLPVAQWNINEIAMPADSMILCTQTQDGKPVLYSMGTPGEKQRIRIIKVYGTGQDLDGPQGIEVYVGTFQVDWFVGHVFDYGWKDE